MWANEWHTNTSEYTTKIGDFSFDYCMCITGDLVIPDSVTSIGKFCFAENKITSLKLSDSLTIIPRSAFRSCLNLSNVPELPSNLKTIEDDAFYECVQISGILVFPKP